MNNESKVTAKSLIDLPSTAIESIFSHLSYLDITRIRGTCKHIYSICGNYLKRSILDIKDDLYQCMYEINKRFACEKLSLDERGILLRAYNMLEILNLTLNTLIVLNRHILDRDDSCLPIGNILDMFYTLMITFKENLFGTWPAYGLTLHNKIRQFTENMERCNPGLGELIPLGVRAMDLLDMLMDAEYEICVIYDIPNNVCYITGCYRLPDSRFLSYLPDISSISECKNRKLNEEELDIIIKYLVLLVNVHNGLLTKSEQYRRELEFSRKTLLQDENEYEYFEDWFLSLKKPKREYSIYRGPVHREVLSTCGEIIEIYSSSVPGSMDTNEEGVRSLIQLKCTLDEAPLEIKESFGYLKNDIILGEKSVQNVSPNIFDNVTPIDNVYGAGLKLEIRIPYNNKQMIDIEFKDGKNILFGTNIFEKNI